MARELAVSQHVCVRPLWPVRTADRSRRLWRDHTPGPAVAPLIDVALAITPDLARELAISQRVCVRPILRRVEDRQTGTTDTVAIPCGSTRDAVCPPCAHKAMVLRMQQCREGWHRDHEPDHDQAEPDDEGDEGDELEDDELEGDGDGQDQVLEDSSARRVRSTRRRQDVPDLPRVPMEQRTIGRTFTARDGTVYRPSMFLTLTLPSYGKVTSTGAPVNPGLYDYRRAALDALHFAKLLDRFWQNLRRCAGYKVQYFSALEPQRRLALHAHAAIRGAIPRALLKQVVTASYVQVWWPAFDQPVYTDRLPVWVDGDYVDPDTGELLPTWRQALDQLDTGPRRDSGACGPVREADRPAGHHRPLRRRGPGDPVSDEVPDQDHRRHPHRRRRCGGSGLPAASGPAARRAPLAAVLVAVCELVALRHPTQERRPRTRPG